MSRTAPFLPSPGVEGSAVQWLARAHSVHNGSSMQSRAFLLLGGLVVVSCGGAPSLRPNPDGESSRVEGGPDAPASPASDAFVDGGQDHAEVSVCPAPAGFACVFGFCANDYIDSPQCLDGAWKCPVGSIPTTSCSCAGLQCLQPPPPPAVDAGEHDAGGPDTRTCTGSPTFFCLPGGCASDTGAVPAPHCVDGAWTCPYGTPSNTCSCFGADCFSQRHPDAAADSSADGPDAKASDAATDAPNDCRTFGCASTQYCSPCLSVDQKVSYTCIPTGAAC
jgi:hypothetical protein